jgi:hypothetical protein
MSEELTPWRDCSEKPELAGVYEVFDGILKHIKWYSFWDGFAFKWHGKSIDEAFLLKDSDTGATPTKWRGLANKPE